MGDRLTDRLVHQDDIPIAVDHLAQARRMALGQSMSYILRIWPKHGLHPKFAKICHSCVEVGEDGQCVEIEGVLEEISVEEFDMRKLLERAVPSGDMILHYQPICSLADGSLHGYEALARLRRGGQFYTPAHFLPYLDGEMEEAWVTQQVEDISAALEQLPEPLAISLNACHTILETELLLELLDCHPQIHRLCLEVLESTSLANPTIIKNLHNLRWLGLALKADDVGAEGHGGGLDRLLTHGLFRYVKFDGHLVRGIPYDAHLCSVLKHLLAICQEEGLSTIAEWVETEGQRDWLLEHGCQMGQGRLFGMPAPWETISKRRDG